MDLGIPVPDFRTDDFARPTANEYKGHDKTAQLSHALSTFVTGG